jgi:hypothetical protein
MADVGRPEGKRNMATLDEIGQEKQRVSERLARLDTERAQLADQLGELEIAERVLPRFGRAVRTKRRQGGGLATTALAAGGERSARDTRRIHRGQAGVLPDPPDPLDIGDQGQRVFEPSMMAHKEAETGMYSSSPRPKKPHCDASVIARNRSAR